MKHEITQAIILAGSYGTRLKPFTDTSPKPMYPFEGKPFLDYLIEQVKSLGIEGCCTAPGLSAGKKQGLFLGRLPLGVHIAYSVTPLEYDTDPVSIAEAQSTSYFPGSLALLLHLVPC